MKRKKITFLELFRKFILYYSAPDMIEERKDKQTITGYTIKYNRVTDFLAGRDLAKILAENFELVLANELVIHFRESCSNDYSVRIAELCRNVLDFGCNKGYIKNHNLHALNFKKSKPKPPLFLTPAEIALFEGHVGPQQKAADLFLFQCYTGLSYMDLMSLTRANLISHVYTNAAGESIERQVIIKSRLKTSIQANIPYFDKTRVLWERYNYELPKMSGNTYRKYLKKICKRLGITKNVTTHTGRKTFAMIKLNYEGYAIAPVSKMLGHASIKTTETYYAQTELILVMRELDRLGN